MSRNFPTDFSAAVLEAIMSILVAVEEGSGGRQRFCETAAALFACGAVAHAVLDPVHHGWSVCLWRSTPDGVDYATAGDFDQDLAGHVMADWWSASPCRRVALKWFDGPYLIEVPLSRDGHECCSVLVLGRDTAFGDDETQRMATMLHLIAVVERAVLRLEAPMLSVPGRCSAVTEREVEVLRLLSEGLIARSIAHRMSVSERTVHKHLENLYQKLDVHDRLSAVIRGQQLGLLPGPHPDT
ncbi:helix-turn-helix domain-containing protein [Mycolicibacterium elephantis]